MFQKSNQNVSWRLLGVLLLAALCTACSSHGRLEDVMVVGEESLQTALQERLERFNRARYWGGLSETVAFVTPKYQRDFIQKERSNTDVQRMVRTDVLRVELVDSGSSAEVEMEVRYFEKPTYLVKTRKEVQTWKYHRFAGGWLLTELDRSSPGAIDQSGPTQMRGMPSRSPYDF